METLQSVKWGDPVEELKAEEPKGYTVVSPIRVWQSQYPRASPPTTPK